MMNFMRMPAFLWLWLILGALAAPAQSTVAAVAAPGVGSLGDHVVLGWNDLGMHCMGKDFQSLVILPPFNNLHAQVIQRGSPPKLVTSGVNLAYRFPANTISNNKVNFWTYAQSLFNLPSALTANIGLTGNGLSGVMQLNATAFEATGVPLTPYEDAALTVEQPYQLAEVTLRDAKTQRQLDQTTFVAPVSVEMYCNKCHQQSGKTTDEVILGLHDSEEGTNLLGSRPVLCARCHASNALGMAGRPELPSLSQALHGKHAVERPDIGCYDCHPGQQTQCLRDAMFSAGKVCQDCHGTIAKVASSIAAGRRPWLDEPKCGTCHPNHAENAGTLYRNSTGHGGLYCTACHNSPHAVLPTVQPRDGLQALRVQGKATYIKNCLVCHTSPPSGPGPHGILTSWSIAQHLTGRQLLSSDLQLRADYNNDGKLNIADVVHQVNRGL